MVSSTQFWGVYVYTFIVPVLLQQRKTFALAAEELYTSLILRDSYSQYSLFWVLMLLKIKFFDGKKNCFFLHIGTLIY